MGHCTAADAGSWSEPEQEKCEFQKSNLLFLGHIIDEKSIRPYPVKTEAVHKMKSPTCVSELRHFREMVNHLGKFSRKLADLSQPKEKLFEFQKQLDLGGSARISVQPDEGGAPHTYYFGPI